MERKNDQNKTLLTFLLIGAALQSGMIFSVQAQPGRIISVAPKFGNAVVKGERNAVAAVKFSRIPRQTIAPAFNAVRNTVTRENVAVALRSSGVRPRAFNVAAGSLQRPVKIPPVSRSFAAGSTTLAVGRTNVVTAGKQAVQEAYNVRKLISPNLSPKMKLEVGKAASESTSSAAAVLALERQQAAIAKTFDKAAMLHKNSRFYRGRSHVYVIVGPDGRLYKVGESARGMLKNGLSMRAQEQVNRLNKTAGSQQYSSRVISTFTSKEEARAFERNLIVRYKLKYKGQRFVLRGNRERFKELDKSQ